MWGTIFGVCGVVAGLGALLFSLRRDRREVVDHRKQLQVEGQKEGEKLSEFVVRQTEAVIRGWEGVNKELQERAELVVAQLQAVTLERDQLKAANDELRGRVSSLESEVATLKGQALSDRETIHRLEREIGEMRGTA